MATIKLRRGTAAQWTTADPVLALGEPGFETDTNKMKIGDGSTAWVSLAYFAPSVPGGGGPAIADVYANIAAMLADQGAQEENAYYWVEDATTDATVDSGWAIYRKIAATTGAIGDYVKVQEQESLEITLGVASVSGDIVNNADPSNPVIDATKSRTVVDTDSIVQGDSPYIIYFNKPTPFNFTIDQLVIDSEVSFINIGAGAVTFVAGAGVTISGATSLAPGDSAVVIYRTATNPIIRAGATVPDQAQSTITGRADGAGTGQPSALNANQASTILDQAADPFLRRSAYENLLLAGSAAPGRYATNVLSLVPTEGNAAFAVGAIRAYVFLVSKEITITRIQTNVTTLGASAKYRIGIYADNGSLYPGDLVAGTDVEEYDGSSTGVKESSAISITLPAGLYWVAVHTDTTINLRAWTSQYLSPLGILNTGTGQNQANSYSLTTPYAAMPSTFPGGAVVTNANPPKLGMLI